MPIRSSTQNDKETGRLKIKEDQPLCKFLQAFFQKKPTPTMQTTNQEALELIKHFEGLRLEAYQDSVGVWTIGYGTTAEAGLGIIPQAGLRITESEAERLLKLGLEKFEGYVRDAVTVELTDNQFGALVSFTYNLGPGNLRKSTLLRKLNSGDYAGAAQEFPKWPKAGGKTLPGLVRRRQAEKKLFEKG